MEDVPKQAEGFREMEGHGFSRAEITLPFARL
jgi:hypothetical protein